MAAKGSADVKGKLDADASAKRDARAKLSAGAKAKLDEAAKLSAAKAASASVKITPPELDVSTSAGAGAKLALGQKPALEPRLAAARKPRPAAASEARQHAGCHGSHLIRRARPPIPVTGCVFAPPRCSRKLRQEQGLTGGWLLDETSGQQHAGRAVQLHA